MQNGVQIIKFRMSHGSVRSNAKLQEQSFVKHTVYLGMKKKGSGKERKSTSTNLVAMLEDYITPF